MQNQTTAGWVLLTVLLTFNDVSLAQVSKRVLMIGIDGAGGEYVPTASTPNLDALAADGAARFDFLNEGALIPNPPEAYGASGVNWSTILTGAAAAEHGVVDNSFAGANFEDNPHFFKHLKQADSSLFTASLANWTPINTFITPDEYADLEVGYDAGTLFTQDQAVKNDAVALLQNDDPDAIFLHFDQVDGAGHTFSWGSPQHTAAIEVVDSLIGEIMAALNNRAGVVAGQEDWLVLVSADHGAARGSFGHVASQGLENWKAPFYVSGPSVEDGVSMSAGTLRDMATTALWHMGVDPFLAGLDGTIKGLEVPPPSGVAGDINQDGTVSGDGTGDPLSDDVSAFLSGWLVRGEGGVAERYSRGDLNADGVTDLADWAILHNLKPSVATSVFRALQGASVPEPCALSVCLLFAVLGVRRPTRERSNN